VLLAVAERAVGPFDQPGHALALVPLGDAGGRAALAIRVVELLEGARKARRLERFGR
jgi:hypothetical protein